MAALTHAFAIDGPAIVDAVVDSNELPNLPHVDLDMIGHFALAKIKEAVLAVTGARLSPEISAVVRDGAGRDNSSSSSNELPVFVPGSLIADRT